MDLPDDSIGVSDILEWRRCPASFVYKMRRHVELPPHLAVYQGELDEPTEATNENNAYGSMVHEAYAHLARGASDGDAYQRAFDAYAAHMKPSDLTQLRDDIALWHMRRPAPDQWDTVAIEEDRRVPLFSMGTRTYYFRFKLDVLYRSRTNPGLFLLRDYKSTAYPMTEVQVRSDIQQWAYNWGVHELYPECKRLLQQVDYLRGRVQPTSKNDDQRAEIKEWLAANVKAILADTLYKPTANEWCRFCPMVVTCRETKRLTTEWRAKLSLFAPLTKEGRRIKVEFFEEAEGLSRVIAEDLPRMMATRRHLEYVEKALKEMIEEMPEEERLRLGWKLGTRRNQTLDTTGLRELHTLLGDEFYEVVAVSMSGLEERFGKKSKEVAAAREFLVEQLPSRVVSRA